jgi:hypothetical protein
VLEATTLVGAPAPGPAVNPLCACDKNVVGLMIFLAIAAGIVLGMILVGFDHTRKRR